MAYCQRCQTRPPEPGRIFCAWCVRAIQGWRSENATAFTSHGLTYASINGREVLPDILVTHESVAPALAAELLARLRNEHAADWPTDDTDLEWDPD